MSQPYESSGKSPFENTGTNSSTKFVIHGFGTNSARSLNAASDEEYAESSHSSPEKEVPTINDDDDDELTSNQKINKKLPPLPELQPSQPFQNLLLLSSPSEDDAKSYVSVNSMNSKSSRNRTTPAYTPPLNRTSSSDESKEMASSIYNNSEESRDLSNTPRGVQGIDAQHSMLNDQSQKKNNTSFSFSNHPGNRSSMMSEYSAIVHNIDIDTVKYVVDQDGAIDEDEVPSELISQVRTVKSLPKLQHSVGSKDLVTFLRETSPVIEEEDAESIKEPLVLETSSSNKESSSNQSKVYLSPDRQPRLPDKEEYTNVNIAIPARSPMRPNSRLLSSASIVQAMEEERLKDQPKESVFATTPSAHVTKSQTQKDFAIGTASSKRSSTASEGSTSARVSGKFDDIMKEFEDLKSEIEADLENEEQNSPLTSSTFRSASDPESLLKRKNRAISQSTAEMSSNPLSQDEEEESDLHYSATLKVSSSAARNISDSYVPPNVVLKEIDPNDHDLESVNQSPVTAYYSPSASNEHTYSLANSVRTGQESFHTARSGSINSDNNSQEYHEGFSSTIQQISGDQEIELTRSESTASTISNESLFEQEVKNLTRAQSESRPIGNANDYEDYEDINEEGEDDFTQETDRSKVSPKTYASSSSKKHSKKSGHKKTKSKIKPFSYDTLARLLNATDGIVIGQEFANLEIPTQEKYLIEQIVDSISRLTANMMLNPNRYDQGCGRLEKVLNALEGFE